MNFNLRAATAADAAVIAATGSTVWISTYALDAVTPVVARHVLEEFTEARIRAQMAGPLTKFWVAGSDDGILGFAELRLDARTGCLPVRNQSEVARLYVLDRFARQGLGRALLNRCATYAFERGADAVWLSAYAGNDRALAFYRALGWRQVGETGFQLGGATYPNIVFALTRNQPAGLAKSA